MKILRIMIVIIFSFITAFSFTIGKDKITKNKLETELKGYQGVISMWQIDSFEGGFGSRKQFLLKVARNFEKKNQGVFIMVSNYTKDGAEENFKNGIFPDIISYGNGVNVENAINLQTENTVKGGCVGDKAYATAWCRGGYVLITNPNYDKKSSLADTLLVSESEFNQPLTALFLEEIEIGDFAVYKPMDAYVKFVSGKYKSMLGTQRDLVRLSSRGMEVEVKPLEKFNDLFQYVSVLSVDPLKTYYAKEFVNYLVSKDVQTRLSDISMLSCFYKNTYDNPHIEKMQIINDYLTISPFRSELEFIELKDVSLRALKGDESAKIKLKNMLV